MKNYKTFLGWQLRLPAAFYAARYRLRFSIDVRTPGLRCTRRARRELNIPQRAATAEKGGCFKMKLFSSFLLCFDCFRNIMDRNMYKLESLSRRHQARAEEGFRLKKFFEKSWHTLPSHSYKQINAPRENGRSDARSTGKHRAAETDRGGGRLKTKGDCIWNTKRTERTEN